MRPELVNLHLNVPTLGALGRYMPSQQVGLLVPTKQRMVLRQLVRLRLTVGTGMSPCRATLIGEVVATDVSVPTQPKPSVGIRVQLGQESWRQFHKALCNGAWRRDEDLALDAHRGRRLVLQRTACEFLEAGHRFPAMICDVSDTGAFLSFAPNIDIGKELRFRTQHTHAWYRGTIRWRGSKGPKAGAGLHLKFPTSEDRSRWVSYVAFASQRYRQLLRTPMSLAPATPV